MMMNDPDLQPLLFVHDVSTLAKFLKVHVASRRNRLMLVS